MRRSGSSVSASSGSSSSSEVVCNGRAGPDKPKLVCLGDNKPSFDSSGLEASNNSFYHSCVKGEVRVTSGKWYFEVRVVSNGNMSIGWAAQAFKGAGTVGSDGVSWGWDGGSSRKSYNDRKEAYGHNWYQGDIVGVLLDADAGTLAYTLNGEELGVAYRNVRHTSGLSPVASLTRRQKLVFNFGEEDLCFPLEEKGYYPLYVKMSAEEKRNLERLFGLYQGIGNKEATATGGEVTDSIKGAGLIQFSNDIGSTGDTDPLVLIVMWKLGVKKQWEISHTEWTNGFCTMATGTIDKMKKKALEWRSELNVLDSFCPFYEWVFDYLRGEQKNITMEDATSAWGILGMESRWKLWPKWVEYLKTTSQKFMTRDSWRQLLPFIKQYTSAINDYDPDGSWPIIVDDFVAWLGANRS
ncbi:defective in cullin neddylation protein 1 [Pelomyxa schiedti]|nr:defective in cullin neddylation protein 1 [Pelomyxa schiedti]